MRRSIFALAAVVLAGLPAVADTIVREVRYVNGAPQVVTVIYHGSVPTAPRAVVVPPRGRPCGGTGGVAPSACPGGRCPLVPR